MLYQSPNNEAAEAYEKVIDLEMAERSLIVFDYNRSMKAVNLVIAETQRQRCKERGVILVDIDFIDIY